LKGSDSLNRGTLFRNPNPKELFECASQKEIDYYWERLSEGGDPEAQACGWLKDKFGLSWQVVPQILPELMKDSDTNKSRRGFEALMEMKKLDIEALQRAFAG
jgi:predicted 3-demethylubiquinone-9 3-methyltransferase (glyoxalase superfamily)